MRASFFVTCAAAALMTSIDAIKFNKVDADEPLSNLAEIDSSTAAAMWALDSIKPKYSKDGRAAYDNKYNKSNTSKKYGGDGNKSATLKPEAAFLRY